MITLRRERAAASGNGVSVPHGELIYNLLTKPKHVVGRNGNLELDDDKSVSRQHAAIYVTVKDKKMQIKLQDMGSKYGTFVNEIEIAKNTKTNLNIGDKIKFGLQWNIFTLEKSQLVVCASMLLPSQKKSLTDLLKPMNGIVVSDWSDKCSYLTINEIQSVTTNVFQALGRVKPIVTLEYWTVLADVLNSKKEESLPDCDDYAPPILEPNLKFKNVDLSMNNNRRKLFSNMKFVACTTTQYNRILLVSHAGGIPIDGTRQAFKDEELRKENIIVMDSDTINKRNLHLAKLLKFLEERKLRRIAEKEIGMSLILNSTDLYCNPNREPEFIDQQSESQIVIKDEGDEEVSELDLETQDLDEESSTQFFNTDSSKFSLAIKDRCDNEDDVEDVQIIPDTPEDEEPIVQGPPAKKKRTESSDQSSSKNVKMTDWVIRKPSTKPNVSTEPPPKVVESYKKPTRSLFDTNPERKLTQKSSDSLFKIPSSSLSSLERVDTTEKRKRTSVELFSTENAAPPAKKANIDAKNLFQMPSTAKRTKTGSLILFESDSVDSASPKPSTSNKENAPLVVPKKESGLQFADPPKNKYQREKKEDFDDMSFDTKDVFNQSIIFTLPLVKSNTQRQSLNTSTGSAVNFKKFKKNNEINRTRVIPTNDLVVYTRNLNLNGDCEPSDYSDSD